MIHRPPHGTFNLLPGHCEPVLTLACPEEVLLGYGNPFPWQKAMIFRCTLGAAGQQSLPCVKGGGVRKDTGGIDAEQLDKLCKIRLLQNKFAASQRSAPFGDAIFLLVKKDSRERHAKEPMVLWKLLHYAAIAFALTYRCEPLRIGA